MKKIVTVVGARPQFVKAAVLSRLIRSKEYKEQFHEVLVHTGQHYDDNMSEVFFRDMQIPKPDIMLNLGGGTHGLMTGKMLIEIESFLLKEKPDMVLVYGDTNSTLAGALAASKLNIPVAHVEAGLRSFNKRMPEEQNRILTDHIAEWLFCPTDTAVANLATEGIRDGVVLSGDIMYDAILFYKEQLMSQKKNGIKQFNSFRFNLEKETYALATIHRAENTDDTQRLREIIDALNNMPFQVVLPIHPRTKKQILGKGLTFEKHIILIEPVGYLEMIELEMNATCIITDSGGVQKEAYFMRKPCVTLRDETEWVETIHSGWNVLAGAKRESILSAVQHIRKPETAPAFYGDGKAGEKILKEISN